MFSLKEKKIHQKFRQKMERTAAEANTSAEPVVIILHNFELTFFALRVHVGFDVE